MLLNPKAQNPKSLVRKKNNGEKAYNARESPCEMNNALGQ